MMTPQFVSTPPVVKLVKAFTTPYQNFLATARTCYSSKGIIPDEAIDEQWDWLAQSLYQAGHHTTLQHAHFQFSLENVSRHFVWSFLHSHPFYNSEQVSQRYVTVKPGMVAIPPLQGEALALYQETIAYQMRQYQLLSERLLPLVEHEYCQRFPARKPAEKKTRAEIQKKAQEVARYVLPVATFTYLYHTISGLSLLRYYRLCQQYDTPTEQTLVVQKMVDALLALEPRYSVILEQPLPLEESPEYQFFQAHHDGDTAREFIQEFDQSLGGRVSKLTGFKEGSEELLAAAVREVLGLPQSRLADAEAIALALNPALNRWLAEPLNSTTHSKLSRCLVHPSYTFRKKISHCADSQDQRHRMTPASRPILAGHLTAAPDTITPALIQRDEAVRAMYDETLDRTWDAIGRLRTMGVPDEFVQYLLPNAVAIRFSESGDLLNLRHKYAMRLCYNAQEEIWRASVDEVQQITALHPRIGNYLLPPCTLRHLAAQRPLCPEGPRYCGEPVWRLKVDEYQRVI
ncbi:MAG: FAD-dependent thymidylate synthase [bacterium]|jgi:thymidylate synthase ThyX|nr:FAD-dependent thymidylate synthase [bacterium]